MSEANLSEANLLFAPSLPRILHLKPWSFHLETITTAILWGALTASGIVVGALLGVYAKMSHSFISRTMAFGAGLLLAAASVELAAEVLKTIPVGGVISLLVGAMAFSLGNRWLSSRGAKDRKRCGECVRQPSEPEAPNSGTAIAMGTAMDAIPEALVLGLALQSHGPDAALIAAITLGNLPEALSASAGMRAAQRDPGWIFKLWGLVSISIALLTGVGFALAGTLSKETALLLQAFGAGALLSMVSETLLPEAAHEGPSFAGLVVALGFAVLLMLAAYR